MAPNSPKTSQDKANPWQLDDCPFTASKLQRMIGPAESSTAEYNCTYYHLVYTYIYIYVHYTKICNVIVHVAYIRVCVGEAFPKDKTNNKKPNSKSKPSYAER